MAAKGSASHLVSELKKFDWQKTTQMDFQKGGGEQEGKDSALKSLWRAIVRQRELPGGMSGGRKNKESKIKGGVSRGGVMQFDLTVEKGCRMLVMGVAKKTHAEKSFPAPEAGTSS